MKHQESGARAGSRSQSEDDNVCIERNVSSEINTPKVIKTKHKTTATATATATPQWVPRLAGDIIVLVVVATRLVLNASLAAPAPTETATATWSNNFHFAANGRKERIKFYEPQATGTRERERERDSRSGNDSHGKSLYAFVLAIKLLPVPFKPPPLSIPCTYAVDLGTLEWSWRRLWSFIGGFASWRANKTG